MIGVENNICRRIFIPDNPSHRRKKVSAISTTNFKKQVYNNFLNYAITTKILMIKPKKWDKKIKVFFSQMKKVYKYKDKK